MADMEAQVKAKLREVRALPRWRLLAPCPASPSAWPRSCVASLRSASKQVSPQSWMLRDLNWKYILMRACLPPLAAGMRRSALTPLLASPRTAAHRVEAAQGEIARLEQVVARRG